MSTTVNKAQNFTHMQQGKSSILLRERLEFEYFLSSLFTHFFSKRKPAKKVRSMKESMEDWPTFQKVQFQNCSFWIGGGLWKNSPKYIIGLPSLNHIILKKEVKISVLTSRLPSGLLFHSMLSAWHHQSYLSDFHNSKSQAGKKRSGKSQVL